MAEVTLTHVTKRFGDFTAVDDISMVIEDGKFIVLVGPSGCGKTTTLRMIAGLEEITSGEISIGDRVVNDVPPKDRDIAMVFQNYALYPHMTVYDNMAFGLKLRKYPKAEIDERVDEAARSSASRACSNGKPQGALRRPAPARGRRPRDRAEAEGLPVRRAALEPRRQAARPDAGRDQAAPPPAADDDDLRDARPGRGDDARRPDRRDEGRPDPAGRAAAGDLRPSGEPVRGGVHRQPADELPPGEGDS